MSITNYANVITAIVGFAGAPPNLARDRAEEAAVFEATLRQQIEEHLDADARAMRTVICLGIDPGEAPQSPSREFMARFQSEGAARRLTECEPRPTGAVEATTNRLAVMVTAGPIEWRAADEAWVTVSYFRSRSQSGLRRYRVVRERTGWVSLGQILVDGPV